MTEMRSLKVALRVDASLDVGAGHVMRCLTLADAMRARGAECHFVCRSHPGQLLDDIRQRGHAAHSLPTCDQPAVQHGPVSSSAYAAWLGCAWRTDAAQTRAVLAEIRPDWLVVDHYALDARWEAELESSCRRVIVLDDLADRRHLCDLLLDQTLGRTPEEYGELVPDRCTILTGPRYALLRPEFADWRERSLERRQQPNLKHILISMGGMDQRNVTGEALEALGRTPRARNCRVGVVMGSRAPSLARVREQARLAPFPTEVHVDVTDMARRMANADLAIGAAGTTSWERCCLGLPALIFILAENQRAVAEALERRGAAALVGGAPGRARDVGAALEQYGSRQKLAALARASSDLVDGRGVERVLHRLGALQ